MVADLITKGQLDACMERVSAHIADASPNIETMTGATANSAGASGTVPQPAAGDHEKFLRGDGTWAEPSGGGNADFSEEALARSDIGIDLRQLRVEREIGGFVERLLAFSEGRQR